MYQLAEHYTEASNLLSEQAKGKEWGSSAPQLLVDSFAVELYLKCLFVIDNDSAPPFGHDLLKLFEALAPGTKSAVRETFRQNIRSDPVLSNLHIINPEAVRFTDFDRSLKAAKNTFDKRRYLYEETPPQSEWFYAHLLRDAFRAVTKMVVPFGGLTPTK